MNKENCIKCPCPDKCLKWDAFCAMAAKEPQIESEINHIKNRSGSIVQSHQDKPVSQVTDIASLSGTGGSIVNIKVDKFHELTKSILLCEHHYKDPPCGCGNGGRCRISKHGKPDETNGGSICTFFDCWHCLDPLDPTPIPHVTKL